MNSQPLENVTCHSEARCAVSQLSPMQTATVVELDAAAEDVTRLKHLGICSGRRVQLVKTGDPLILRVLGSRIGLSGRLAQHIYVEPCTPGGTPAPGSTPESTPESN